MSSYTITSTSPSGNALKNATRATVKIAIKITGGGTEKLSVPVIRENGAWKVCQNGDGASRRRSALEVR